MTDSPEVSEKARRLIADATDQSIGFTLEDAIALGERHKEDRERLTDFVAHLEARNAELEADAKRMDWLAIRMLRTHMDTLASTDPPQNTKENTG